jgi:hypothetical protein
MALIGVVDLLAMNLIGLLTGWLGLTGTVFCQQPDLVYVAGCFLEGKLLCFFNREFQTSIIFKIFSYFYRV